MWPVIAICLAASAGALARWGLGLWLSAPGTVIPWGTLAILMAVVAVSGIAAGWLAVRAAIRAPLVAALRGD